MKKLLTLFLGVILAFTLSGLGCNGGNATPSNSDSNSSSNTDIASDGKILVAYFSATNHTENVANYIAETIGGTLFELVPVNQYTSADLNYNNSSSRVSREHNDESLRNIELTVTTPENWEEYDVIFIGYPIWWGIAAWSVNNFVKLNDFTGKTVIPFATSASSGIGNSDTLLKDMSNGGNWISGQRFPSSASKSTVETWVKGLNLVA